MLRRTICMLMSVLLLLAGAVPAFADDADYIALGEACLRATPPDYANAEVYFKRAGRAGNPEGYYRIAGMYEQGMLSAGDPCTDDLEGLGMEMAKKYYAMAAHGGYEPAREKLADAYRCITQDEAAALMEKDHACTLVDVRTQEEYAEGHIPGAICIPVESITEPPALLRDYDTPLLIYCRSGRRSKQAASKLASLGYTDVMEFGGILDWSGDIITSEEDTAFLAMTGLSKMAAALRAGAVIEKAGYSDGNYFNPSGFTTAEPEEIQALWNALRRVELGEPTARYITDVYPRIVFLLDNGRQYSVSFDGWWLDEGGNFEIGNAEEFWALTRTLMARYAGQ